MTSLFWRFYLAVVVVLFAAWAMQDFLFRRMPSQQNNATFERVYGGGARTAAYYVGEVGPDGWDERIEILKSVFDYTLTVFQADQLPMGRPSQTRLFNGEVVYFDNTIWARLPQHEEYFLRLGPLPQFAAPPPIQLTLGLGLVLLMAAGVIALMLRPIARQFRALEKASLAIADGDLSARVSGSPMESQPIANAFNRMAVQTERMVRDQQDLLQAVSHELRTPLAKIRFATELLEIEDEQKRKERIDSINDSTERLDDLVGELLAYARADQTTPQDQIEAISVQTCVAECLKLHGPMHSQLTIQRHLEDDGSFFGDRRRLLRVVNNLVGNACRYAKSNLWIQSKVLNGKMLFWVGDDGPGISDEDQEKVLQPFVRLDDAIGKGSGLGLALVQRIANRSGGSVQVSSGRPPHWRAESEFENSGALFCVELHGADPPGEGDVA